MCKKFIRYLNCLKTEFVLCSHKNIDQTYIMKIWKGYRNIRTSTPLDLVVSIKFSIYRDTKTWPGFLPVS